MKTFVIRMLFISALIPFTQLGAGWSVIQEVIGSKEEFEADFLSYNLLNDSGDLASPYSEMEADPQTGPWLLDLFMMYHDGTSWHGVLNDTIFGTYTNLHWTTTDGRYYPGLYASIGAEDHGFNYQNGNAISWNIFQVAYQ